MTVGEDRVRVNFNPSSVTVVDVIKMSSAQLIDLCNAEKEKLTSDQYETLRLWSLAQTAYEEAAMWAVKAATAPA